jgi:hypothetical protein
VRVAGLGYGSEGASFSVASPCCLRFKNDPVLVGLGANPGFIRAFSYIWPRLNRSLFLVLLSYAIEVALEVVPSG